MLRRLSFLATSSALVIGIVSLAAAASVHFKGGNPTFADQGLVLNSTGALAGLGNGDITVVVTATGTPTATCTNQGGNQAPGQNPAQVNVSGTQNIPASSVKNGTVSFNVTTAAPAQPTAKEAGCPSDNWKAAITDVAFSSATLTVYQNGVIVLQKSVTL